jgi:hypothetical protein
MPVRTVQAVCFDVGNVLVEIDVAYAIARLGRRVDDRLSQKIQALGQWETYDAFERGHMLEAQFLRVLSAYLDCAVILGDDREVPLRELLPAHWLTEQ